jgi:hypothetical protein
MKIGNRLECGLALFVCGGAQQPVLTTYEEKLQRRVLAAKHWGSLANTGTDQLMLEKRKIESRLRHVHTRR